MFDAGQYAKFGDQGSGCRFQIHVTVLGFEINDVEACEIGSILGDTSSSKLRG